MKKNNIGVLISIIVLLVICLPAAIYGTFMNYKSGNFGGNPNHEFFYKGNLYFYNNDKLLGTYACKTEQCNYAKNYVADAYKIDDYNVTDSDIKLINNHYAFIQDGDEIVLYNVIEGTKIVSYQAVKNYSVGINDNSYLVKNNKNLWGMIKITDTVVVKIPNNYTYLGLKKIIVNNQISADKLVAYRNNEWHILNTDDNILFTVNEEIADYNDKVIVTHINGVYHLYNYAKTAILENYQISSVELRENYIIATTSNNYYIVYNSKTNMINETIFKNINSDYEFTIENNLLVVKENGEIIKTIA